jgi:hypothetical protein
MDARKKATKFKFAQISKLNHTAQAEPVQQQFGLPSKDGDKI